MLDRPCYEVQFSDGSTHRRGRPAPVADRDPCGSTAAKSGHDRRARAAVVTTEQMASSCRINQDQRANHSVANARPLVGEPVTLPIAPYALGAWLGDGHSAGARITCETPEIPMLIEACGYDVSPRGAMLYGIRLAEPERAVRGVCSDCGDRAAGRSLCRSCYREHGSFVRTAAQPGRARRQAHPRRVPAGSRSGAASPARRPDGHRRNGGQGRRFLPVRGDQPASGRRRLRARRQPRLQVRPDQQASARPLRGDVDVLHPQLLHDRRRLPAPPQAAACTRRSVPARPRASVGATSRPCDRFRACRCGASRSTTTTTCTSPARSMIPTHNSTLGARPVPGGVDPEQPDELLLQPRDDALRDHHAAAVGRGAGAAQPHPQRPDERRRLDAGWPARWPRSPRRRCSSTTRPT